MKIPIEISARHVHLCQKDLELLFNKNYQLKKLRNLSQPNDWAAKETLTLKNGGQIIKKVRIVGPTRKKTQVELSFTDAYHLKVEPPIRKSGNLRGSAGFILVGPRGRVQLKEGVIVPQRHIHFSDKEAKKLGLKEGDLVSVEVAGKRGLVFNQVIIRVDKNFRVCMHLDTDEGNACGIIKKGTGRLIYDSCS